MYGALNIDKKITNLRDESFEPNYIYRALNIDKEITNYVVYM